MISFTVRLEKCAKKKFVVSQKCRQQYRLHSELLTSTCWRECSVDHNIHKIIIDYPSCTVHRALFISSNYYYGWIVANDSRSHKGVDFIFHKEIKHFALLQLNNICIHAFIQLTIHITFAPLLHSTICIIIILNIFKCNRVVISPLKNLRRSKLYYYWFVHILPCWRFLQWNEWTVLLWKWKNSIPILTRIYSMRACSMNSIIN